MIILSNCLTQTADEGSLKVANSLIKRIKNTDPNVTVVSYERKSELSDRHMNINKLLLNQEWIHLVRKKKEPVLYVPFPTRMLPMAVRIFLLSLIARWGVRTLLVMNEEINGFVKFLLKYSKSEILTVSRFSYERFRKVIGTRAVYLKTGVDTIRFAPVDSTVKQALREKYGIPLEKKVVLHVGHLKEGRNVGCLLGLCEDWQILLAVSTLTAAERDNFLREQLSAKKNVKLFEDYIPQIQELYQLADVYLFPVLEEGNCIDVPLSALEAAACGIPVVATAYGELQELLAKPGFYSIQSFEPDVLEHLLSLAMLKGVSPRQSVMEYDWEITVKNLLDWRKNGLI